MVYRTHQAHFADERHFLGGKWQRLSCRPIVWPKTSGWYIIHISTYFILSSYIIQRSLSLMLCFSYSLSYSCASNHSPSRIATGCCLRKTWTLFSNRNVRQWISIGWVTRFDRQNGSRCSCQQRKWRGFLTKKVALRTMLLDKSSRIS